ncbi:hypothetical protein ARMGADRAFT_1098483, partial [Armillaria gallica]
MCIEDLRTVSSIVWSCLATIFACTSLAVHPNVPGRNITTKGAISHVVERAKIMAVAILAPEVIVGWAVEQCIVAWKLCHVIHLSTEQKDQSKLTLAHGFFLSMGGFYYISKYVPGTLVTLEALASEPNLVKKLEEISLETIEDKSKGDALSKTVSILQISWFIVQCTARALQFLPITLLEMTALAFAGLSIVTYLFWWYKPLDVKYHISLDASDSRPMPETHD